MSELELFELVVLEPVFEVLEFVLLAVELLSEPLLLFKSVFPFKPALLSEPVFPLASCTNISFRLAYFFSSSL